MFAHRNKNKIVKKDINSTQERGYWIAQFDQRGDNPDEQPIIEARTKNDYQGYSGSTLSVSKIDNFRGHNDQEVYEVKNQKGKMIIDKNKKEREASTIQKDYSNLKTKTWITQKYESHEGRSIHLLKYLQQVSDDSKLNDKRKLIGIMKVFFKIYYDNFLNLNTESNFDNPSKYSSLYSIFSKNINSMIKDIKELSKIDFVKMQLTDLSGDLPPLKREEFELDPFQTDVCNIIDKKNSDGDPDPGSIVLSAPTSSGKSVLSMYVIKHINSGLIIFVVPSQCDVLAWQMASRFEQQTEKKIPIITKNYKSITDRNELLKKINDSRNNPHPVIVGTAPCILDILPEISRKIAYIVFDEIHQITSEPDMESIFKIYSNTTDYNAFNFKNNEKLDDSLCKKGVPFLALSATIGNPDEFKSWCDTIGYSDVTLVKCTSRFFNLQFHTTDKDANVINVNPLSMISINNFIDESILSKVLNFTPPDVWDLWEKIDLEFNDKNSNTNWIDNDFHPIKFFDSSIPKFKKDQDNNKDYYLPSNLLKNNLKRISLDDSYNYASVLIKTLVKFTKSSENIPKVSNILNQFSRRDIMEHEVNLCSLFFKLNRKKFYIRDKNEKIDYNSNKIKEEIKNEGNKIYRKFTPFSSRNKDKVPDDILIGFDFEKENLMTPVIYFVPESEECLNVVIKFARNLFRYQNNAFPERELINQKDLEEKIEEERKKKDEKKEDDKRAERNNEIKKEMSRNEEPKYRKRTHFEKKEICKSDQAPDPNFSFEGKVKGSSMSFSNEISEWSKDLSKAFSGKDRLHWILVLLWHGIGVYVKSLPEAYLRLVQKLALQKRVNFVFSDDSLQFGVSMPFRTSIIHKIPGKSLDKISFQQMGGRAGRRGEDTEGHVILSGYSWDEIKSLCVTEVANIRNSNVVPHSISDASKLSINSSLSLNYKSIGQYIPIVNVSESVLNERLDDYNLFEERCDTFTSAILSLDYFSNIDKSKLYLIELNRLKWGLRNYRESLFVPLLVKSIIKLWNVNKKEYVAKEPNDQVSAAYLICNFMCIYESEVDSNGDRQYVLDTNNYLSINNEINKVKDEITLTHECELYRIPNYIDSRVFLIVKNQNMNHILDKDRCLIRARLLDLAHVLVKLQNFFYYVSRNVYTVPTDNTYSDLHHKYRRASMVLAKLLTRCWWCNSKSNPFNDENRYPDSGNLSFDKYFEYWENGNDDTEEDMLREQIVKSNNIHVIDKQLQGEEILKFANNNSDIDNESSDNSSIPHTLSDLAEKSSYDNSDFYNIIKIKNVEYIMNCNTKSVYCIDSPFNYIGRYGLSERDNIGIIIKTLPNETDVVTEDIKKVFKLLKNDHKMNIEKINQVNLTSRKDGIVKFVASNEDKYGIEIKKKEYKYNYIKVNEEINTEIVAKVNPEWQSSDDLPDLI